MKRNQIWMTALCLTMAVTLSCSDSFLDISSEGAVLEEGLGTVDRSEGLISPADAGGANSSWNYTRHSEYVGGSIRSGDAYKGGSGVADQSPVNDLEQYCLVTAAVPGYQNNAWEGIYEAISRINLALQQL